MLSVALACTLLLVNFYRTAYRPGYGLTKLILFGSELEPQVIPQLRTTRHFLDPDPAARFGYDGQFYAQVALDPALRQPELATALDTPGYRARRIGLPAVAWVLGLGKARWVLQTYALANALFWLLLLGVTLRLLRPWSGQGVLCLAAVLLGTGTVASLSRALTDVPATSLLFASLAFPVLPGAFALAAAILTRETSLLALPATLESRDPLSRETLRRNLRRVLLAVVPFGLWFLYVRSRFPAAAAGGTGNFAPPLQEMALRVWHGAGELDRLPRHWDQWQNLLFFDHPFHEVATPIALFCQGIYLGIRPGPGSAVWRVGALYALLGVCLGAAVWEETNAAARALLPMTVACYLRLATERNAWVFWPFFAVATLPALNAARVLWLGE